MPNSKNLNTYYDVSAVLTAARANGGAVYELPTPAAAKRWRFRAYAYRALLNESEQKRHALVPGYTPTTPWDDMYLTVEGSSIIIQFGTIRGVLRDMEGAEIDHTAADPVHIEPTPPPVANPEDPLLSMALELVKESGK